MIEWSEWSKQHTWHYIHDHLEIKFQKASEYIHASLDDKWMNDFFFGIVFFFKSDIQREISFQQKKIVLNLSEFECWWLLSKRKNKIHTLFLNFPLNYHHFFCCYSLCSLTFILSIFLIFKIINFLIIEELDSFDSFWCIAKRQK